MTDEPKLSRQREAAGMAVIILAAGMAVALNILTVALLWAAAARLGVDVDSGLSPQGASVLLGWGGGIISVIAGYVGYVVGKKANENAQPPSPPSTTGEPPHA